MHQKQTKDGSPAGHKTPLGVIVLAVIGLALIAVLLVQNNGPAATTRPAAASCQLSQPHVEDGMVSYLRAHAAGDAAQKEALRDRLLFYTACAPGVRTALDIWLRAVDADNQEGMTAADGRLITAFRQLRGE